MKTKSSIVSAISVSIILGVSTIVSLQPAESQVPGQCFVSPENTLKFAEMFLFAFPRVTYPNITWDKINQAQVVINRTQHWIHHELNSPCEQQLFQFVVNYPYKTDVMKARVELIDPDGDGDIDKAPPKNVVPDTY